MKIRCAVALLLAAAVGQAEAPPNRRSPVVVAVEKVSPAVVNISTEQVVERQLNPFPGFRDPFFDEFFRDFSEPRTQRFKQTSLGSGIIIRPDGYVLTNQHVIERAARIKVTVADSRDLEARLIGADADSDLAVLKVEANAPLPYTEMGNSDDLLIGETVIAIGNPFGLSHTVTTGVISAVGRSLTAGDQTYYDFIQTDASINPGNSGGPLLNITGELIGINTAIYQKAQGIGFAIPINRARRIVTDLISYGEVHVPWIGAVVHDVPARAGATHAGVVVGAVESDSPAAAAGIQPGDVITAMDGRTVGSLEEYDQRVRDHAEHADIRLSVERGGAARELLVHAMPFPAERADALAWQLIGIEVSERDGILVIHRVRPGSSAARIGIEPGDALLEVAGSVVRTQAALRRQIVALRLARAVLLAIRRGPYVYHVNTPLMPPA